MLGLPFKTAVIAAGGMSYYSLTGAFMTGQYGIEVGAYGFLVNVMREFITIPTFVVPILLPIWAILLK
ncbi:MAG: LysO family transporter [Eubacteriales bacterium]